MEVDYLINHLNFVEELNDLFFNEWSYLYPGAIKEEWQKALIQRAKGCEIPTAIVAFESGILIGSASLLVNDMDDRPELTPWLAAVFVKKPYRSKGIGKKLIQEIEAISRKLKIRNLYLYTPSAEDYYRQIGWNVIENRNYHGTIVAVMQKSL